MANRSTQSKFIWWYQGVHCTISMHSRCNEDVTKRVIDECPFTEDNTASWFSYSIDECPSAINVHGMHMFSTMPRSSQSSFNQQASTINPEQTSVGYLLIKQAPAHELDKLNTCHVSVAESLRQEHVVWSVDKALYLKLMELMWSVER